MGKMFYRHIRDCLARQQRLALATVVARSGSGPREAGASMIIEPDGTSMGTVGGGLLEAQVLAAAQEVLHSSRPLCLKFSLTAKEAGGCGMLCGGEVEVLIDLLDGSDTVHLSIFEKIVAAQEARRNIWLIQSIHPEQPEQKTFPDSGTLKSAMPVLRSWVHTGLGLLDGETFDAGSLDLSDRNVESRTGESGLSSFILAQVTGESNLSSSIVDKLRGLCFNREASLILETGIRYLIIPVGMAGRIVIAGAGHVARELATLCHFLDLPTTIIDDRREFACPDHFPASTDILISPDSFRDCFTDREINENCAIVIVTRGHEHDRTVLVQALQTCAGYIGMIGSRRKRDIINQSLLESGFSSEDLARVHCPIGLPIGARTPAEIAVSIAAELITWRNGKKLRTAPILFGTDIAVS